MPLGTCLPCLPDPRPPSQVRRLHKKPPPGPAPPKVDFVSKEYISLGDDPWLMVDYEDPEETKQYRLPGFRASWSATLELELDKFLPIFKSGTSLVPSTNSSMSSFTHMLPPGLTPTSTRTDFTTDFDAISTSEVQGWYRIARANQARPDLGGHYVPSSMWRDDSSMSSFGFQISEPSAMAFPQYYTPHRSDSGVSFSGDSIIRTESYNASTRSGSKRSGKSSSRSEDSHPKPSPQVLDPQLRQRRPLSRVSER
jgi:hypothetical protein